MLRIALLAIALAAPAGAATRYICDDGQSSAAKIKDRRCTKLPAKATLTGFSPYGLSTVG